MKSALLSSLTYALIFQTMVLPVAIAQNQNGDLSLRDGRAELADAQAKVAAKLAKLENVQFLGSDGDTIDKDSLKVRSGEIKKAVFAYEHNGKSHSLTVETKSDTPKISGDQFKLSQTLIVTGASGELGRTKIVISNTLNASDQEFQFNRSIADLETQVRTRLNQTAGISKQAARSLAVERIWRTPTLNAVCIGMIATGLFSIVIGLLGQFAAEGHPALKVSLIGGIAVLVVSLIALITVKAHDNSL